MCDAQAYWPARPTVQPLCVFDMNNTTEQKPIIKRFGTRSSAFILFLVSILFFVGSYIKIIEHYPRITESTLSLTMVSIAGIATLTGIYFTILSIRLLFSNDKNT